MDSREKSSEWPQFTGAPRGPDGRTSRSDRRTVTNPNLTLSAPSEDHPLGKLGSAVSINGQATSHSHGPAPVSRRGSPPSLRDNMASGARSVPATPLNGAVGPAHLKTPGTPHTPDIHVLSSRLAAQVPHQLSESAVNAGDLQASLSRLPPQYENGYQGNVDEVCHDAVVLHPVHIFYSTGWNRFT